MSNITAVVKHFPSIVDIDKVSAIADPVNRNLNITQSYYEISRSFASRTGETANWCTFATWASRQAGVTIRGEDLRNRLLDALTRNSSIQQLLKLVLLYARQISKDPVNNIHLEALKKIVESSQLHASNAVARGNKKVYDEIAREFSLFMENCMNDECYDTASIEKFCAHLLPGSAPAGQEYLSKAFRLYYEALFELNLSVRYQKIYFANVLVGYHEQTRLQPEILESMNAERIDSSKLKDQLTNLILKNKSTKGKLFYFLDWIVGKTDLFKKAIDNLVAEAETHIRKVITDQLMTLRLPTGEVLELGDDLLREPCPELVNLDLEALVKLLEQLRISANVRNGAGCTDWSDLSQRIHYIAYLFRCYQDNQELLNAPFSDEQVKLIKAGAVPPGDL
jgi:hypothetical protein